MSPTDFQVALEGNHDNPILQPWAAAEVRKRADAAQCGRADVHRPQEVCQHSGVPNVITLPAPVLFIQQPKQVMILYQRDHQVRRIHMNVPHSPNSGAVLVRRVRSDTTRATRWWWTRSA